MNDKQLIKSFTVKEQAYLIVTGLTGSWMYDATHKELKSEEYCQRIVDNYWSNYGDESLSMIAMYARDTVSRCPDCGGRILFKCNDCEQPAPSVEESTAKCPRHLRSQLHVEHKDYLNKAEAAISEKQVEKMDNLVNEMCDGYTSEELAYLLYQLQELNHRGDF